MATIAPLKGLLYNTKKITPTDVVAPPYDVIQPDMQDELYKKSDYNIVRLILGKEYENDSSTENRYTRAASTLFKWRQEGALKQDAAPAIYLYQQEYTYKEKKYFRQGFIAKIKVEDYKDGIINPHERTLAKPKADRLNLLRACKTNLSQIFYIYSDPKNSIEDAIAKDTAITPYIDITDSDGVTHKLGIITHQETINSIVSLMKDKKLYIADGHHRYETALNYRNETRENTDRSNTSQSGDFVMGYFTNMDSSGTAIFPIHRLVHSLETFDKNSFEGRLREAFSIETFPLEPGGDRKNKMTDYLALLEEKGADKTVFGYYNGDNLFHFLTLTNTAILATDNDDEKDKELNKLDVNILHTLIFTRMLGIDEASIANQKNVAFKVDEAYALEHVDNGSSQAAFFLNPTKLDSLQKIVNAGGRMPQKSTFFYPKLKSGLVMNPLDD